MIVNAKELAAMSGINRRTIYRYRVLGMPSHISCAIKARRLYETELVKKWMALHAIRNNLSKGMP